MLECLVVLDLIDISEFLSQVEIALRFCYVTMGKNRSGRTEIEIVITREIDG